MENHSNYKQFSNKFSTQILEIKPMNVRINKPNIYYKQVILKWEKQNAIFSSFVQNSNAEKIIQPAKMAYPWSHRRHSR